MNSGAFNTFTYKQTFSIDENTKDYRLKWSINAQLNRLALERQRKSQSGMKLLLGNQSIPNSFLNLSVNLKLSGGSNLFFAVDLSVMTNPCP